MAKQRSGQRKKDSRHATSGSRRPKTSAVKSAASAKYFELPAATQRWLPPLFFLLTTLIFFWPQLSGSAFFWEDFVEQFYPWQSFAAAHTGGFTLPHWNPYAANGMPFLADAQVGYFYPPHWLLALFTTPEGLPVGILQGLVILHFFVAQWGMYALARHWGCSAAAAIFAGLVYGLSAPLVLHAFHPMIVYHLAWFPLIIRFAHQALTGGDWKPALYAGLLLGMTLLSGHPQTSLYVLSFLGAMALWFIIAAAKTGAATESEAPAPPRTTKPLIGLARMAIVFALGFALFCIQYFPTSQFAAASERNEMTYEAAAEGSLQFSQLFSAVTPKIYGQSLPRDVDNQMPFYLEDGSYYFYWETGFYAGCVALLFALAGMVVRLRSREGAFLLAAGIFALLFAFGGNGPLFPLMYHLPFFGQFRFPPRMLFFAVLAIAMFAGWGLDAVLKQQIGQKLRDHLPVLIGAGVFLLISLATVSGILPGILGAPEGPILDKVAAAALPIVFLLVVATLVYWLGSRGMLPGAAVFVIVTLAAFFDAYNFGADFNRTLSDPAAEYAIAPEQKTGFTTDQPDSLFRVKMREGPVMAMKRNQGLLDSIALFEVYNPLLLKDRHPPTQDFEHAKDLLNIRYEVKFDPQQGGYWVERPNVMPRARMVYNVIAQNGHDAVKEFMQNNEVDYRRNVVLEQAAGTTLSAAAPDDVEHSIKALRYEHNLMEYEVSSAEPGVLVLSETWYPAWKATINGQATPVLRANHAQRAIEIPAGTHEVRIEFDSDSFANGRIISIAALVLALAALIFLSRASTTTSKE